MISLLFVFIGGLIAVLLIVFTTVSLREKEKRAAGRGLILFIFTGLLFGLTATRSFLYREELQLLLLAITVVLFLIYLIPVKINVLRSNETPAGRIDERDIMFSRKLYKPGTERFERYYQRNPQFRAKDDAFRQYPGLLNENAALYEPFSFNMANSIFNLIRGMQPLVDLQPLNKPIKRDPADITSQIKNWLLDEGCVSAGVAKMKDYHYYSHVGRGEDYGSLVTLNHPYGIVFTVEMDKEMMDSAPHGPTVLESARQYLNAAGKALQLAQFIRESGYEARPHIDGNYRVVCPLVARDAGLGEIGRMGLLMTPELGPRVRIGVVTTDMPLKTDERRPDSTMLEFCRICKKCAEVCPARAISVNDREEIDGVWRWQIDQEACYTLWCKIGTDCGRCMAVCPYSHPDTIMHNLVRNGIARSRVFARLALWMDDFFYGKKPAPKPFPEWLRQVSRGTR